MRIVAAFCLILGVLAGARAQAATAIAIPIYTVTSHGGGLGYIDNEVTIISRVSDASPGSEPIWIAERRRNNQRLRDMIVDHQWIDGRRCPALRISLEALAKLPAIKIGAPSTLADTGLAFDAPLITLRGPPDVEVGSGVQLSRSEYLGPVVDWRSAFTHRVESCWRNEPVAIPGAAITAKLLNEADLELWMR